MRFEPGYLLGMALQTIPEPRKVARDILSLRFPRAALWQAFALFAVLATGLNVAALILFPPDPALAGSLLADPLRMGMIQTASLVITVFLIYWMGRAFGGTGTFPQAILTVIWMQYVAVLLQLAVLVLALFSPSMAALGSLFSVGVSFWILSHFITEMHGFRSAGLVFATIVILILALGVVLGILLALAGVSAGVSAAEVLPLKTGSPHV